MEKLIEEQKLHNKRFRSFRSKVKKSIKKNGLRSGELLLEYWQSLRPKEFSLKEIDLYQDEITAIIETEIASYKSSLPTQ